MALSTAPHCEAGPDSCFGCKARYWRENGSPAVRWGGGYQTREQWRTEPSLAEKQKADRAEAAATGKSIEPAARWV